MFPNFVYVCAIDDDVCLMIGEDGNRRTARMTPDQAIRFSERIVRMARELEREGAGNG